MYDIFIIHLAHAFQITQLGLRKEHTKEFKITKCVSYLSPLIFFCKVTPKMAVTFQCISFLSQSVVTCHYLLYLNFELQQDE